VRAVGDDLAVRPQLPLTLSEDSEPEADLAVVPASDALDVEGPHPRSALLVIEVTGLDRSSAVVRAAETVVSRTLPDLAIDVARLFG
jgi:hypothetical protein